MKSSHHVYSCTVSEINQIKDKYNVLYCMYVLLWIYLWELFNFELLATKDNHHLDCLLKSQWTYVNSLNSESKTEWGRQFCCSKSDINTMWRQLWIISFSLNQSCNCSSLLAHVIESQMYIQSDYFNSGIQTFSSYTVLE